MHHALLRTEHLEVRHAHEPDKPTPSFPDAFPRVPLRPIKLKLDAVFDPADTMSTSCKWNVENSGPKAALPPTRAV